MKIGINGFEAIVARFGYEDNLPRRVGSSEFCFQLLKEIERIDKSNEYVVYLPDKPTSDLPKERDKWRYEIIPNVKLWTIFGLTRKISKDKSLDLFFSPTHYAPPKTPCPQIISILDVSYKYFPEMFPAADRFKLNTWGKYSIELAEKIITISNSSRNDIINEYKVSPDKVDVVHLGIKENSKSKMTKKEFIAKNNLEKPYILFVGTLQPRKNIVKLIEAFSKISDKNLDLVIVGRKGWDYEDILNAPERFEVSESVRFFESVTDNELPSFYENAEVFVLPSLYEGFGLPILEAMKYGCPVVTSNVSSLPEAGGDAALYCDPNDAGDIAEKIKKVIENDKLKNEMIKKGYEQVEKFSWEKSAKEVIKIFESIK